MTSKISIIDREYVGWSGNSTQGVLSIEINILSILERRLPDLGHSHSAPVQR